MSILSKNNISVLPMEEEGVHIAYLPLVPYAVVIDSDELQQLKNALEYEGQQTVDSKKVIEIIKRKDEHNMTFYDTPHDVEKLRSLMILPNNKCNFHCAYCYSAGGRTNEEIPLKVLNAGISYFLDAARAKGEKLSVSVLGGGEPLLSWKILQPAFEHILELRQNRSAACPISLVTNGSIYSQEITDFLKLHDISLSISFDILEDVQNEQRGQWDKVSVNINRFANEGLDVALNTVISNKNVARMTEMIEHLHKCHPLVKKVSFKLLISKDYFNTLDERRQYYRKFVDEFFKAKKVADNHGIWLTCSYLNTCLCVTDRYCPGKFVITSEGDISTCHTVGSRHDELYEEFVFGHIDANSGNVYINQEKLSKILSFGTKSNEECKDCPAHWHCAGGCYADSFHLTKKEHDAYCESMRLFLRQYLIYKFDL